jgi:hypothetical protein
LNSISNIHSYKKKEDKYGRHLLQAEATGSYGGKDYGKKSHGGKKDDEKDSGADSGDEVSMLRSCLLFAGCCASCRSVWIGGVGTCGDKPLGVTSKCSIHMRAECEVVAAQPSALPGLQSGSDTSARLPARPPARLPTRLPVHLSPVLHTVLLSPRHTPSPSSYTKLPARLFSSPLAALPNPQESGDDSDYSDDNGEEDSGKGDDKDDEEDEVSFVSLDH